VNYRSGVRVWTDTGFATIVGRSLHCYATEERDPAANVAFPPKVILENGYRVRFEEGELSGKVCHIPARSIVGSVRAKVRS
jgi:hypothetical protein